jgi:hypothetical protein
MPQAITIIPSLSGGSKTFHLDSAATVNATLIKTGQGQLTGWYVKNTNAADRYLVFHDIAGTPIAGSGIWWKMGIPASGAANALADTVAIQFSNGLAITTVVNPADSDNTAVAIHDLIINLFYR